MDNPEKIST